MRYLLTCNSCQRKTPVDAGRAGQSLRCGCGAMLEVPSIRGLRSLPRAPDDTAAAAPTWNAQKGLLFLGAVLLAAGVSFGGYLFFKRPPVVDTAAIDLEIGALDPAQSFLRFSTIEPPLPMTWRERASTPEEVPAFLRPSANLMANFEAPGTMPLAADEARQAAYRQETRRRLTEWLPLAIGISSVGLLLVIVGALSSRQPAPRRQRKS